MNRLISYFLILALMSAPSFAQTNNANVEGTKAVGKVSNIVGDVLTGTYSSSSDVNNDKKVTMADVAKEISKLLPGNSALVHALAQQSWYGDAMGETPEDTVSKKLISVYDSKNRLIRKIQTTRLADGSAWRPYQYYKFAYDDNDRLVSTCSYKNVDGTTDLKLQNDAKAYEYNSLGQLVKETDYLYMRYYVYEYTADNQLKTTKRYSINETSGDVLKLTITYSGFTTAGATEYTSVDSYGNITTGKIAYNTMGCKISELQYNSSSVLKAAEYWTYDSDGMLTLYEKKSVQKGEEMNGTKIVYDNLDANTTRVKTYTYTASTGRWASKGGSTYDNIYADMEAKLAPADVSVDVHSENSSATLSFNAPTDLPSGSSFVIHRNGLTAGKVDYVTGTTSYSYTEEDVANGTYEYIVQTFSGGIPVNGSGPIEATLDREFPHATDLHAVSARMSDGYYYVTLAWTNPEITEDMKFVTNDIMRMGTQSAVSLFAEDNPLSDPTIKTVEVSFDSEPEREIFVKSIFKNGYSTSEKIRVNAIDIMSGQ